MSSVVNQTKPGQFVDIDSPGEQRIVKVVAATYLARFESIREQLADIPPPRRPQRCKPLDEQELLEVDQEIAAWDAASDDDFEAFENELDAE